MICYHVTPAENLDTICVEGLKPSVGPRANDLGEVDPRIYLFPDADALEGALSSWLVQAFDPEEPLACLVVDADGLDMEDSPAAFELTCAVAIPPDRLKLLSRDIWEEIEVPDPSSALPVVDEGPQP